MNLIKILEELFIQEEKRKQLLINIGGICVCCGESELLFLTIDHKNNDGANGRRNVSNGKNKGSSNFYNVLLRQDIRDDLQVLCANCNFGKSINNGICPHVNPFIDDGIDYRQIVRTIIPWPDDKILYNMVIEKGSKIIAEELGCNRKVMVNRLNSHGYKICQTKIKTVLNIEEILKK